MATKEAQISVRLPTDLDDWIEHRAGGKRGKAAFIRRLLERERAIEEEGRMQEMFDKAWDSLSEQEREGIRAEREAWLGAYAGAADS